MLSSVISKVVIARYESVQVSVMVTNIISKTNIARFLKLHFGQGPLISLCTSGYCLLSCLQRLGLYIVAKLNPDS